MKKIRVLLSDDHAIVRMGLVSLLNSEEDIAVVGEADDGESAIRKALKLKPDVVVMDLMMPGTDGIAATSAILAKDPSIRILILTTSTVSDDLAHALDAGAHGVVTKSSEYPKLLAAIRSVAAGNRIVPAEIERLIAEDPPLPRLSPRQAEILQSVTQGLTNADIAKQLGISSDMVKEHLNAIFQKLGASGRSEAITIALRKHLLKI